ncbi:MAG: efflux RND transporter periplasmic adaptor subunit [Rickettsiales bacterium]
MKRKISLTKRQTLFGAVLVLIIGTGIYYAAGSDAKTDPSANQAIPVTVQTMAKQNVRVWSSFSGRLQAVDSAEIRPQVGGRIVEVRFEDGQLVKAGDVLFVIEPEPYEAAVARAEANLASATTQAAFAKKDETRAAGIVKKQAISRRTYDERVNANKVAEASLKAAEAELKQAKLDLDHAYVKAPISGRVSRAEITVGNLVQTAPNAPLLTTVVSNDDIYADFEVDEQTYIKSIRNFASGPAQERKIPVQLSLQGDKDHAYDGTIYSFDNQIDTGSGTIRARAKFRTRTARSSPACS